MYSSTVFKTAHWCHRAFCAVVAGAFLLTTLFWATPGFAQGLEVLNLPVPGTMVNTSEAFVPVLLKGMTLHPDDPFRFDFIIDSGNTEFTQEEVKQESERLIKYFLASMTVPKDDLWVNLSPHENDRIIPDELGKTALGRDLLAQDYLLKQITASLMYPEDELGSKFWKRIYKKAQAQFGTTNIPVNTFNKVWIMPESATVYESGKTVYVVGGRLKVLLEEDYLAMSQSHKATKSQKISDKRQATAIKDTTFSSKIVRELILPELEREVNEGKNFAPLRQIYHSLILSKWYKQTIKEGLLAKVYVDHNNISGVALDDSTFKEQIYAKYMEAYKKGVYNFIKKDYDEVSKKAIPRKYFSGGIQDADIDIGKTDSTMMVKNSVVGKNFKVGMEINSLQVSNDEAVLASSKKLFALSNEGASLSLVLGNFYKSITALIRKEVEVGFAKEFDPGDPKFEYVDRDGFFIQINPNRDPKIKNKQLPGKGAAGNTWPGVKKCFLCFGNMPKEEFGIVFPNNKNFKVFANPSPYESNHVVITENEAKKGEHPGQFIEKASQIQIAVDLLKQISFEEGISDYVASFNSMGAANSSPHFHLQAFNGPKLPVLSRKLSLIEKDGVRVGFVKDYFDLDVMAIESNDQDNFKQMILRISENLNDTFSAVREKIEGVNNLNNVRSTINEYFESDAYEAKPLIPYNILFKVTSQGGKPMYRAYFFPRKWVVPRESDPDNKALRTEQIGIVELSGQYITYSGEMAEDLDIEAFKKNLRIASFHDRVYLEKAVLELSEYERMELKKSERAAADGAMLEAVQDESFEVVATGIRGPRFLKYSDIEFIKNQTGGVYADLEGLFGEISNGCLWKVAKDFEVGELVIYRKTAGEVEYILNEKLARELQSIHQENRDRAKTILARLLDREDNRRSFSSFYNVYKEEYRLLKEDLEEYGRLLNSNQDPADYFMTDYLGLLEALNADPDIIQLFNEIIDVVEGLENEVQMLIKNPQISGIRDRPILDVLGELYLEKMTDDPTYLRNRRINKAYITVDADYFGKDDGKPNQVQKLKEKLNDENGLKGTFLDSYRQVLTHRGTAQGRESFFFLAKNPIEVVRFSQTKNIYMGKPHTFNGRFDNFGKRQYYALHKGPVFSFGVGVTEAENPEANEQTWHVHEANQEYTISLSDNTLLRYGHMATENEVGIIKAMAKEEMVELKDNQEHEFTIDHEQKKVICKNVEKHEYIIVDGEKRIPHGHMSAMPKGTFHTIKNMSDKKKGIDFTIKDPVTQLIKDFAPSEEVVIDKPDILKPQQTPQSWGVINEIDYPSPFNMRMLTEAAGQMRYQIRKNGKPVPMMGYPQNLRMRIVEVNPGKTTDAFEFRALDAETENLQIIRLFPWPREMPEKTGDESKDWYLYRDHSKITAKVAIRHKNGRKEEVQIVGGDLVLLDNKMANEQITSFRVENTSKKHTLMFYLLEPTDKAMISTQAVKSRMTGHHLADWELERLREDDEKDGFISERSYNRGRVRAQLDNLKKNLPISQFLDIDQVINWIEEDVEKHFKGEEVHILNDVSADGRVIGRIDRKVAETFGFAHETSNIVLMTPDGKVLLQLRNKDNFDEHLAVYGGHLSVGQSFRSAAKAETLEETGMEYLEFDPVFVEYESYNKEGDNNKERRAWFVKILTEREYKKIKEEIEKLNTIKTNRTLPEVKEHLTLLQKKEKGAGEVVGIYPVSFENILNAPKSEYQAINNDPKIFNGTIVRRLKIKDAFNRVEHVIDAPFTPDALNRLLSNPILRREMEDAIYKLTWLFRNVITSITDRDERDGLTAKKLKALEVEEDTIVLQTDEGLEPEELAAEVVSRITTKDEPVPQGKVVTVFGTSASGKTTTVKALAKKMNAINIYVGLVYRALAFEMIKKGVEKDPEAVAKALEGEAKNILNQLSLIVDDDYNPSIQLNGQDIKEEIDKERFDIERTLSASVWKKYGLHDAIKDFWLNMISNAVKVGKNVVVDIRPEQAEAIPEHISVYLTADVTTRAGRRANDRIHEVGLKAAYEEAYLNSLSEGKRNLLLSSARDIEEDQYIVSLSSDRAKDAVLVGGKGMSLAKLVQVVNVPDTFLLSSKAFNDFVSATGISKEITYLDDLSDQWIQAKLDGNVEFSADLWQQIAGTARYIRKLFISFQLSEELRLGIENNYERLSEISGEKNVAVMVRSSATYEDLEGGAAAGQHNTYPNVVGKNNVVESVRKSWASLFNERAIEYRNHKRLQMYEEKLLNGELFSIQDKHPLKHHAISMGVVIQRAIEPKIAGIGFSIDPVSGKDLIRLSVNYGFGDLAVSGDVTSEAWWINPETFKVAGWDMGEKIKKAVTSQDAGIEILETTQEEQNQFALTDDMASNIAREIMKVVDFYSSEGEKSRIDTEFLLDQKGKLYFVQARPITGSSAKKMMINLKEIKELNPEIKMGGRLANIGAASGVLRYIDNPNEVNEGDIIVTFATNPDWVLSMSRAKGIITLIGDELSHSAIVSRELNIPSIVGTGTAFKDVLQKKGLIGQVVTIDTFTRSIYKGELPLAERKNFEEDGLEEDVVKTIKQTVAEGKKEIRDRKRSLLKAGQEWHARPPKVLPVFQRNLMVKAYRWVGQLFHVPFDVQIFEDIIYVEMEDNFRPRYRLAAMSLDELEQMMNERDRTVDHLLAFMESFKMSDQQLETFGEMYKSFIGYMSVSREFRTLLQIKIAQLFQDLSIPYYLREKILRLAEKQSQFTTGEGIDEYYSLLLLARTIKDESGRMVFLEQSPEDIVRTLNRRHFSFLSQLKYHVSQYKAAGMSSDIRQAPPLLGLIQRMKEDVRSKSPKFQDETGGDFDEGIKAVLNEGKITLTVNQVNQIKKTALLAVRSGHQMENEHHFKTRIQFKIREELILLASTLLDFDELNQSTLKLKTENDIFDHPIEEIVQVLSTKEGKSLLDQAQLADGTDFGGIDMNNIDVNCTGAGVDIQFDPAKIEGIENLQIESFVPVIINITPLPSILPLLGLETEKPAEELALSKN